MPLSHAFRPARYAVFVASLIGSALAMGGEPATPAPPSHPAGPSNTELVPEPGASGPIAGHDAKPPTEASAGANATEHPGSGTSEHGTTHDGAPATDHGEASTTHEAAGHHIDYTADDDQDGKSNWMDADNDAFVLGGVGQHLFNLVVIGAVLFFVARRPLMTAIKERAVGIRLEVTEAAKVREDARQRHEALVQRLTTFEGEVRRLRAEAEADVQAEEQRLTERAQEEAVRIGQVAERNIRDELVRAQAALRKEAIDLAVQLAETTLRAEVGSGDQQRLATQFLASIRQDEGKRNG